MTMDSRLKKIAITGSVLTAIFAAFLIYSLAGLTSTSITFSPPPAFVAEHANKIENNHRQPQTSEIAIQQILVSEQDSVQLTTNIDPVKELLLSILDSDNASNELRALFTHSNKAIRIRVALAFADLNARLTHDESSDFREKRITFYKEAESALPDVQNALFEALIVSAIEQTNNYIPYTLAWMPGQGQKTLEVFSWAAQHHPNTWIRDFAVYFVVQFGNDRQLASALLKSRLHDPDYMVRKQVFDQRMRIFKETIFGKNET